MHAPIQEGLEGYLAGKPDPAFDKHVSECAECRQMVELFESNAKLVRELRAPLMDTALEPAPGFYARVMERVDQQKSSSIWSVFLEPLFARRLMYATATLTVLLGVFLFTSPKDADPVTMAESAPESILVDDRAPTPQLVDAEDDRNTVFVQFATYQGE